MKKKRKRHTDYPWGEWLAIRKRTYIRGVDFDCMPYCMAQQFRNAARNYWVCVSIKILGDSITVKTKEIESDE